AEKAAAAPVAPPRRNDSGEEQGVERVEERPGGRVAAAGPQQPRGGDAGAPEKQGGDPLADSQGSRQDSGGHEERCQRGCRGDVARPEEAAKIAAPASGHLQKTAV